MGRASSRDPGRFWPGLLLVAALAVEAAAEPTLPVPAVPFIPQSEALCGGAALAMVLRYWGAPDVRPEDFAGALTPEGTGIAAYNLAPLAESRGFRAFPFRGTQAEVASHLGKGRPVIALLRSRPGRYHYVVVLAWVDGRVLVHDPARGPFRMVAEREWQERWDAAGAWSLLVLPAAEAVVAPARDDASAPDSSETLRERAALEFRQERWAEAAELATEAVREDPQDELAWRLLATSRFLQGRRLEALAAWNEVGEPRLDLVQIAGLQQTPAPLAHAYLGDAPGSLLTPARLRLAARRIEALPAAQLSRVSYRPKPGGKAELEVNVVESPSFSSPKAILAQSAMHAVTERAFAVEAFGLAPSGDSLRISGYFRPERSRGVLSASAPRFLGLPGIATAEVMWDEQTYGAPVTALEASTTREQRARASFSVAHWLNADTRLSLGVAGDQWISEERFGSLAGQVERRLWADHVSLRGEGGGWWSGSSAPFFTAAVRGLLRTQISPTVPRVCLEASYDFASAAAPLALWAGAGTGAARPLLLRAHPLLRDDVIEGAGFGRRLVHGGVQAEAPLTSIKGIALRGVAFADVVKVVAPASRPLLVDVGAGLRVQPPGWKSALRVDVATPWGHLRPHVSAGWQTEW